MEPRLSLWFQCQFCDAIALVLGKDIREDGRVWCHICHHEMGMIEQEDNNESDRQDIPKPTSRNYRRR